ncbi:UDP-N-acetylmuramoylalanyl-D-glutamate--2, 6-diaminopimelate ligase [Streptococcus pyogenes]|nr:UDP-N-acetylmuramoylalanyl-D-glutamate--2, 6-diaminopimelate ligase [Streptococcus pyogenes]
MKTLLGIIAGKAAQSILTKLGRGSTYPGQLALACNKDILKDLSKDYDIVVVTGTNGKTLTTALTVGILKEAFGEINHKSKWCQYDYWNYFYFFSC